MQVFKGKAKRIGKGFAFFLILFLILAELSNVIIAASKKNDTLIQDRNKNIVGIQKEPENTVDMLVVGDSLSYTSISPMQLWKDQGITSYICGQSGQKIQEMFYMLKTAFETQKPKVVLLETNVLFRAQKGLDGLMSTIAVKGNYYFPIFRFHNVWKPILMGKSYEEKNYKGFLVRDTVDAYDGSDYMKETNKNKEMSDVVLEYLDCIRQLCQENGADVVLVSTPSPKNYNYRKHNTLEAYAEENEMDYLDLNLMIKELGIDWQTDSLDHGDHLNLNGAGKVTDYLETYLQSHFDLADHRGDAAYGSWETEAEAYEAEVEAKKAYMQMLCS